MTNKITNLFSAYTGWLALNFQAIAKLNSVTTSLKLMSCESESGSANTHFVVQVSGKNIFPKLTIQDFLRDRSLLSCFNSKDQEVIRIYLSQHQQDNRPQPTQSIVARSFDRTTKQFVFTIEYLDELKTKKRTIVKDVMKLSKSIHQFSSEDAFLIGIEVGNRLN